ncbi:Spy/CpxP family protein refolding chaperone [uncultured Hydrogenophaga sp.]|uniref:Spy/CpxP family protein refolding chaperone n=1 Tax=uncultured Hydrogenophaga sp. TaxID=199683 RepID=UPI0025839644|nr:Spy/CpxP family protein refolding chaperone [uncultured Hydrogenophaga sp.]
MKPSIFSRRALAVTAAAAAITALSFGALAQNVGTPAQPAPAASATKPQVQAPRHDPQRHAQRMERMQQRIAEHQSRLKDSLQLRPEQESAWNDFLSKTKPAARSAGGERLSRADWAKLSTPQRLDRLDAMKAERDRQMAQRHDAIRQFYAQLTPPQQKAFDAQRGMGIGGARHVGHRGGPMNHGGQGFKGHGEPRQPRL